MTNANINSPVSEFDHFARAYIETAIDDLRYSSEYLTDVNLSLEDVAEECLEKCLDDCATFWDINARLILSEHAPLAPHYDGKFHAGKSDQCRKATQGGYDLYVTRVGHGVGFWEDEWSCAGGAALDACAEKMGNVDFYCGDDGKIYQ
jgi:hypothetical protein